MTKGTMVGTDQLSILVAMGAGLLSFLSPCVLPIFPSYLSFVAGVSFEEMQGSVANPRTRRTIVVSALLFILGFALVFVSLGASVSLLGGFFFEYQRAIRRVGGILIILFGISIAGALRIPFLMRYRQVHLAMRPAGYLRSVLIGITFAAGWTPCVGPILGSILLLASTAQTAGTGVVMLGAYSLGLAVPFFLGALALGRFLAFFDRFKRFLPVVSTASGVLLIIVGALLVTDRFTYLNGLLIQFTPRWLFERL